jgi:hypothetical protein
MDRPQKERSRSIGNRIDERPIDVVLSAHPTFSIPLSRNKVAICPTPQLSSLPRPITGFHECGHHRHRARSWGGRKPDGGLRVGGSEADDGSCWAGACIKAPHPFPVCDHNPGPSPPRTHRAQPITAQRRTAFAFAFPGGPPS